jgi:hypothetical protein
MEHDAQMLIGLKHIQERQIAIAIRLFDHMAEIADGLMVVQDEAQSKRRVHARQSVGKTKYSTPSTSSAYPAQLLHSIPSYAVSFLPRRPPCSGHRPLT